MASTKKLFHTGTVKKTITINAPKDKVWRKISNIAGLPEWVVDVKKTDYLSRKKKGIGTIRNITFEDGNTIDVKKTVHLSKKTRGVGAIRKITFNDGNTIEEHVVAWKTGEYFTYIATEGLPLRAYVATISINPKTKNKTQMTWQSYINSEKMSEVQFMEFLAFMGSFYQASLENLKRLLER